MNRHINSNEGVSRGMLQLMAVGGHHRWPVISDVCYDVGASHGLIARVHVYARECVETSVQY